MADISQITVDGVTYDIKDLIARAVANSKTTVTVGSALSSGTQIATITVDGTPYIIYAPAPSQSIDLGELYDQLGGWQSHIQEIIYTIYGYDRTAFSSLSVEEALSILADIGAYYPDIQVSLGSGTPIATISDGHSTTTLYAPTPPSPYTSNPVMDGTASPGSSANYARGDHKHPTDTSRQATLVSGTNIKTINGNSLLGSGNITISGGGAVSGVKGDAESTYRTGNVNLTSANIGAVDLDDKYTRSSAGSLDWTSQTDGNAKVIAKSALAFWNGAYSGNSSNLSKCSTGNIIGSNGGTMTGQLLTSFKSSVAMGSFQATATTIPDLANELRFSSGCTGSVNIGTAYTKGSVTIPTGWYNFFYSPHRSGGVNGAASGDNCNYGTILLSGMTVSGLYRIRVKSSSDYVTELEKVYTSTTPYITAQGTVSGGWMYRVWSNNFQEVWFRGTVTYSSASSSFQGWYRSVQNITIPISSMTGMSAFADDATAFASGAHNAHIHTCGGVRTNGTQFEAQTLGMNAIAANTVTTGWSVYIAGYKR